MRGDHVCISHEHLWSASRSWSDTHGVTLAMTTNVDAFERACGIEFHTSRATDGVYAYHVMDAHLLMMATLRYGWRVTPDTT